MEGLSFCSSRGFARVINYSSSAAASSQQIVIRGRSRTAADTGIRAMATQKPPASKTVSSRKASTVIVVGDKGANSSPPAASSPVKLLTRVEQLKLLTKAEKAGLLSAAEKLGLSLSSIEKLGLLSKAEDLGVLSAATDPGTPGALFTLSLVLLVLGPSCAYLVPEQYPWQIVLQVVVALVSIVGGSAAFAASNLVSDLQKLK